MNVANQTLLALIKNVAADEGQTALKSKNGGGVGFTKALLAEIEQLRAAGGKGEMPSALQKLGRLPAAELQEIADLLGKNMPVSPKQENGGDLEKVLAMLQEALQQLKGNLTVGSTLKTGSQPALPAEKKLDGLLQWLAQNQGNPAAAALLPVIFAEAGNMLPREASAVQSDGANNRLATLLQNLSSIETADNAQTGTLGETEVLGQTKMADALGQTKVSELALETVVKAELKEQQTLVPLGDGNGDKSGLKMPLEMLVPVRQDSGSPPKTDVPAMTKPFTDPGWNQQLGERVQWLTDKAVPVAELRLNPQHLGPISVRIDMDHDKASIAFSAHHAMVRDAIEAAVPKLREMLGAQQLNLIDVNVSQPSGFDSGKSFGQGQMAQQQAGDGSPNSDDGDGVFELGGQPVEMAGETADVRTIGSSNGLLSLFA